MKDFQKTIFAILLFITASISVWGQNLGDVNHDQAVNIVDALLVAQYYVQLGPSNFDADLADVDSSGIINIVDSLLIAQLYVGLINTFPGTTATPDIETTPAPGNLVVNGDFESNSLSPWSLWNEARIGDWKAAEGAFCAAVGPKAPASIEQTISVEANMVYELSAYLYVDNPGEEIRLGVKDYGGSEISRITKVKNWEFHSLRFTTAEFSTSARIYLYKATGTGWGYGDEVEVKQIGPYTGGPQAPGLSGNWSLVFQDEFESNSLDTSKWGYNYPWSRYHNHRAYMDPANVEVRDGKLRLIAENKRHPDAPEGITRDDFGYLSMDFTSGAVHTSGKYHFNHGYMEARLKLPASRGFWPAFWTLGDGWPPEIDIMEFLSSVQNRFYTNYHWGEPSYGSYFVEHFGPDFTEEFHVFAVEWDSSHMAWYLDGSEIARYTGDKCKQAVNQYILLNLAVGGWEEDPDSTTVWPGIYEIDWVRVWQKQ